MSKRTMVFNLPVVSKLMSELIPGDDEFPPETPNIGFLVDGELVGGVCYNHYTKSGIAMHVAFNRKGCVCKRFIQAAFRYPFIQLGCRRVTGLVRVDNPTALKFDLGLGFRIEGVMREADDDGCDMFILGMTRNECKWLKGEI